MHRRTAIGMLAALVGLPQRLMAQRALPKPMVLRDVIPNLPAASGPVLTTQQIARYETRLREAADLLGRLNTTTKRTLDSLYQPGITNVFLANNPNAEAGTLATTLSGRNVTVPPNHWPASMVFSDVFAGRLMFNLFIARAELDRAGDAGRVRAFEILSYGLTDLEAEAQHRAIGRRSIGIQSDAAGHLATIRDLRALRELWLQEKKAPASIDAIRLRLIGQVELGLADLDTQESSLKKRGLYGGLIETAILGDRYVLRDRLRRERAQAPR